MSLIIQPATVHDCLPLRHAVLWPDLPIEACAVPDDDDARHFVASDAGRIVGCGSFFHLDPLTVRLRKMAVLPTYQGRGIGTALICHAAGLLRDSGYERLVLDARSTATAFYARLGLSVVGDVFVKQGLDYVRMEGLLPTTVRPLPPEI